MHLKKNIAIFMTEDKNIKEYTYKQVFIRLKNILIHPVSEWKIINTENHNNNETLSGSFILLAMCALTRFLSVLFSLQEVNYEPAMKHAIIVFSYLFGGMYLTYFVMKFVVSYFLGSRQDSKVFKIVIFSATPLFLVNIIVNLVPELFLIYIFSLYGFYIAYTGFRELYGTKIKQSINIGMITILALLLFSFLIRVLFFTILSIHA